MPVRIVKNNIPRQKETTEINMENMEIIWQGGNQGEEEKLRLCYEKGFHLAEERKFKNVVLPLLPAETYGFPRQLIIQTAIKAASAFLLQSDMIYI